MKFAGIIAEYDPFHNGHAWQLAQAKSAGGRACGRGHELRADPAGERCRCCRRRRVRPRWPAEPTLCLPLPAPCARAGGGGFARAGCGSCRRRVRCAGVRGETPDAALLMEVARVLNSEAYRAALKQQACRRGSELCRRPAGGGAGALPRHRHGRPAGQAQQQSCRRILQSHPRTGRFHAVPIALPRQGADHGQALTESHAALPAPAPCALWRRAARTRHPGTLCAVLALKLYKQAEYDAGRYTDFAARRRCELALLRAACAQPEPFAAVRGVSGRDCSTGWKTLCAPVPPTATAGRADHGALPQRPDAPSCHGRGTGL